MKIFVICSVRGMSDEYRKRLESYVELIEKEGHKVHLPHRDTKQDATGWEICRQNASAIFNADIVHVFYSAKSQGTHFDMGVAFALNKPVKVIEIDTPEEVVKAGKSYVNMLREWEIRK